MARTLLSNLSAGGASGMPLSGDGGETSPNSALSTETGATGGVIVSTVGNAPFQSLVALSVLKLGLTFLL